MANLITDGFDWFPSGLSTADRQRLWAANGMFETGADTPADVTLGRFDFGEALLINYSPFFSNGKGYVWPVGANLATGFVGFALFVYPDMSSSGAAMLQFYDAVADVPQLHIEFAANGVIKAYNGSDLTTSIANSDAGSFQENEWFHVEIKPTIANSGGGCEVRINTVPKLQLVGADTQNSAHAYFDSVCLGAYAHTSQPKLHCAFDDFFVNDTTGSSNNDWAGNLRVKTQFMIANGATDNFAIGGSAPATTNWQSVLNQSVDDTKYVFSSTVGNIDLYTPDPNLNAPLVRAVQVRMALRQDDATQRVGRAVLRIGSTNYPGAVDQFTNQTFTFYKERWQLSPATGVTFTGAEVNGLQAGIKVQA